MIPQELVRLPTLARVLALEHRVIAERAGIHASSLSRMLRGERALTPDAAARIEAAILEEVANDHR